jgi:hypothetical protein
MPRRLRRAIRDRDRVYRLSGLVEVDDTLVGGRRAGKRGRGAKGKTPLLLAVENQGRTVGFAAAVVLPDELNQEAVHAFARHHLTDDVITRSDALPALASLAERHTHHAHVTPPEQATAWLPKVHLIIANLKRFILGILNARCTSARVRTRWLAKADSRLKTRRYSVIARARYYKPAARPNQLTVDADNTRLKHLTIVLTLMRPTRASLFGCFSDPHARRS